MLNSNSRCLPSLSNFFRVSALSEYVKDCCSTLLESMNFLLKKREFVEVGANEALKDTFVYVCHY